MSNDPKIYGVIVEWKQEGPLIMEGKPMTCAEADFRMRELASMPTVIRTATFKIAYHFGNETLIDKE